MSADGIGVGEWPNEPPVLSDGEVALRPWRPSDASDVFDACQDPEIQRWTTVPTPYLREHAEGFVTVVSEAAWSSREGAPFCVTDATDTAVGSCSLVAVDQSQLVAEVGYWIGPGRAGRGIAERAVRLLAAWALGDAGLERLELLIEPDNVGSIKVAERLGCSREGLLRRKALIRGERRDMVLYSLVK